LKILTKTRALFALFDTLLVIAGTLFILYYHDGEQDISRSHQLAYISFPILWLTLSALTRKFRLGEHVNHRRVLSSVLFSNFVILAVIAILAVLFRITHFSRLVLFGTVSLITLFELVAGMIYVAIQQSVFLKDWIGLEIPVQQSLNLTPVPPPDLVSLPQNFEMVRESIVEESGKEAFDWISRQLDITDPHHLILSTDTRFNILNHPAGFYTGLVNLQRVNNLRRINKFFETVNAKLPTGGLYLGCGETYWLRKQRILAKFPPGINWVVYTIDFFLYRVFPKLALTNKVYFLITRGRKRVISRTEVLGRLYSCGFEVLEEKPVGNLLYWKARKIREPFFDPDPSYGVFIRLRRIGKGGEEFNVFKLRTMHAYAEYVQHYVYDSNKLDEGGKFKNDFRVTTLGRVLRKLWIDELPMLLNIVKGNMKLVGVRPLSRHYFSLYRPEMQELRIRSKPGLIPPYYAQHPTPVTLEEVQENERVYLEAYAKHPFTTDVKYFFRAMHNIFWRRARSK
jgi:lipopolysaccharide/colanic/teichoic acid biosynthesis glycosyltransferase